MSDANKKRRLRKKLKQIYVLEQMERDLTEEEELKLDAKEDIRSELQQLIKEQEETMVALTKEIDNNVVSPLIDQPLKEHLFGAISQNRVVNHAGNGNHFINCLDSSLANVDAKLKFPKNLDQIEVETDETQCDLVVSVTNSNEIEEEKMKKNQNTKKGEDIESKDQPSAINITKSSLRSRKHVSVPHAVTEKKSQNGSSEKLLQELNMKMGLCQGHHHDVCAVDLHENFVISGGRDTSVKVWRASTLEELKSIGGHDGTITGVKFMSDKDFDTYPNAITVSFDCSIRVWDLQKGKIIKSIYVYSPVICLDYSDNVVAIGTEAGKLELYNVDTGDNLYSVIAFDDSISAVKILADKKVAVGSSNGIVKVFKTQQTESKDPCFVLDPATITVRQLNETDDEIFTQSKLAMSKINCITCHGDNIIYGDDGYNIKVLDVNKGEIIKIRNNLKEYCPTESLQVVRVQNHDLLFSTSFDVDHGDGSLNVRSLPDLKYLGTIHDVANNSGAITCCCINEVDSLLRLVTGGSQLRVWDQIKKKTSRKRKSSDEDASIIPCKYVCSYTESRESEIESDSDESQFSQKRQSIDLPEQQPATWNCTLL